LNVKSAAPAAQRAGSAQLIAVPLTSIRRVKRRREIWRAMVSSYPILFSWGGRSFTSAEHQAGSAEAALHSF
jgi:hypothetical protein